jgi:phosphoribosyl 1,2-cyclic phosphate phosphodiesterase
MAQGLKITVLGCGTSGGVPQIGGNWGVCDPQNPKNRRRRPSILIQSATTTVLVDTGPDIHEQLTLWPAKKIDAVIYTHDHADHTHGIDDLRFQMYSQGRQPIPVYTDEAAITSVREKFGYALATTTKSKFYPPLLDDSVGHGNPFLIGDIEIKWFMQPHGAIHSLGLRIGDFAYSTDAVDFTEEHFQHLEGIKTWIVDAVRYEPHQSHAHLDMALSWIDRLKPQMSYLTHMSNLMDYETLCNELPDHVRPAYDGLVLDL